MLRYIAKRLLLLIPVLLGISLVVLILIDITPGDPARMMLGAELLNVHRDVGHRLRAVDEHAGPVAFGHLCHFGDGEDRAQAVEARVKATTSVFGPRIASYCSSMISPRSVTGMTRSTAPFSLATICQGTILA